MDNILASLAILKSLEIVNKLGINFFSQYKIPNGRGDIKKIYVGKKKINILDESYNSNPLSLKFSINKFDNLNINHNKKYLLLGDMLELGDKSEELHKNLSKVINNTDIDKVFIKGDKTLTTYKNIHKDKRGNIFQQEEDIDFTLNNIIANNDYLMIKGSNATGLNNFSRKMIKGF